jgi:hypothetical protein
MKNFGKFTTGFGKPVTPIIFWSGVFLLLFLCLQKQLAFHFYYIEQEQLFLWSRTYFLSVVSAPAGLSRWLTEFCVQYFIQPYLGALIMSAWFTLIGMLTAGIIKRIAPGSNLLVLSLLPVIFLIYVHFDINYFYSGTIAFALMLAVMYGYFRITPGAGRIIYAVGFGVLLFWCAGATAFLFVVCIFLWELLNRFSRAYFFILPILLVAGLAYWCVRTSLIGEYRFLFLPDGYFAYRLHPSTAIYFSWIFMPVLLVLCRILRNRKEIKTGRKYAEIFLQLLLVTIAFWFGINKFANRNSDFYKELDYYMRTEQWDKIIKRSNGDIKNYLYLCCLNVALAEKGELAERMFSFSQKGVQGIYVPSSRVTHISVLLSDIYFSMGHIALAQQMAFEANESMPNAIGSRMLQRLIQTNLIYGAYPVAEKYIALLEQTKYYKNWAYKHRRFLWNDKAVENDPLLGMKRRCIPESDLLAEAKGLPFDLENSAEQNPNHRASLQYAGAIYLLSKEMLLFKNLLEKYYGTEVLPTLPKSYQEAVIILSEQDQDPSYLTRYGISTSVIRRFNEFKSRILANGNNSQALPGLLKGDFGDTYWYYYMFK